MHRSLINRMAKPGASDLRQKILDGLERLAFVMRADARRSAAPRGINASQEAILRLLLSRNAGLRVQAIADHLGVSQPRTRSLLWSERGLSNGSLVPKMAER